MPERSRAAAYVYSRIANETDWCRRLTFSQELQDKIAFDKTPYHYCAVSGNVDLAALLYSIGTPFDEDIHIAKFAADGSQSTTPWKKILAVSPVDTARMAGMWAIILPFHPIRSST